MNKPIFALFIAFSFLITSAEAASYKEWRKSIKAAHEARGKGDLQTAREILEGASADAARQGPDTFAENSIVLADVLLRSHQPGEALRVINGALEKMGNPSRKDSTLWKGLLFSSRATIEKELNDLNAAYADAEAARRFLVAGAGMDKLHPELANVHWLIGEIAMARKDFVKAEDEFRNGLRISELRPTRRSDDVGRELRSVGDYSSSAVLLNHTSLGNVCVLQNKNREAEDHYNDALKFAQKEYGKNSEAAVVPLAGRATLYYQIKRQADFEADTQRIYEFTQKPKPIDAKYIKPIWLKFGAELSDTNRQAATETAEKIVTVFAIQNYGTKMLATEALRAAKGEKNDRARVPLTMEMMRKAAEKKFGGTPSAMTALLAEFALDAERAKEIGLARYYYDLILKIQEIDREPLLYAATADKIADILIAQKQPADALPYLQKVTAKLREKYGNDSRVAFAMDREAAVLKDLGQTDAAKELQAKASAIHAKALLKR